MDEMSAAELLAVEKGNARCRARARRQAAEGYGVTVDGMRIATDPVSQAKITGAAVAALDEGYSCQWKTVDGFVTLSNAQIRAAASAVQAYIQSCFDAEAATLSLIDAAETVEAVRSIV